MKRCPFQICNYTANRNGGIPTPTNHKQPLLLQFKDTNRDFVSSHVALHFILIAKYSFYMSSKSCQFFVQVKVFGIHLNQLCISLDLSSYPSTKSLYTLWNTGEKKTGSKSWKGAEHSEDLSEWKRVCSKVQIKPKKEEDSELDCKALDKHRF